MKIKAINEKLTKENKELRHELDWYKSQESSTLESSIRYRRLYKRVNQRNSNLVYSITIYRIFILILTLIILLK